jgi:penicillin G amidase
MQMKRRARKALIFLVIVGGAALSLSALGFASLVRLSLPKLEGEVTALGLSAPVTAARDALGAPTLRGRTRADLAWALGYLHAQERFFQMDLQRRAAAGELSELIGPAALKQDRATRIHRFRHRTDAVLGDAAK